jgi:hypothetical protein
LEFAPSLTGISSELHATPAAHSRIVHRFNTTYLITTMFGNSYFPSYWNWRRLFSYGEVVCFVSAWIVGILVAIESQRATTSRPPVRNFAATNDTLGIQANLNR